MITKEILITKAREFFSLSAQKQSVKLAEDAFINLVRGQWLNVEDVLSAQNGPNIVFNTKEPGSIFYISFECPTNAVGVEWYVVGLKVNGKADIFRIEFRNPEDAISISEERKVDRNNFGFRLRKINLPDKITSIPIVSLCSILHNSTNEFTCRKTEKMVIVASRRESGDGLLSDPLALFKVWRLNPKGIAAR